MDGKFTAMKRTVLLVKKYGQTLPPQTQSLYDQAPQRWSNLKTKVSLAKQRLGPRIQEESEGISKVRDLIIHSFHSFIHYNTITIRLDNYDLFMR